MKLPFLRKREKDVRENGYWSVTVLRDAQQRPDRLSASRDRQADYASIQRSDIEALAKRSFASGRWFQFVDYPRLSQTTTPSVQAFGDGIKISTPH